MRDGITSAWKLLFATLSRAGHGGRCRCRLRAVGKHVKSSLVRAEEGASHLLPASKGKPVELGEAPLATFVTKKLLVADIEKLLIEEGEISGTRSALTDEEMERFERREWRDTIPAPPLAEDAPATDTEDADDER